MPRFAILVHNWPIHHWDLFLEDGDGLLAWRLLEEPHIGRTVPAEPTARHRTLYLDYQGPVSGHRGTVTRWDVGRFEWIERTDRMLAVRIEGAKIVGRIQIVDGTCTILE